MNRETIAKKLTALRGDRSSQEVANAVGISVSALWMYENGERVPRDEIKMKLAEHYNTTVEDLFFSE